MFLYKWPLYDKYWPFFAMCVNIFHKTEVLTVILRWLMGLNLDWFKSYGLRCNLRQHASSANSQKMATDIWQCNEHTWPFFANYNVYLSQNWDSDGHFEVLNKSQSDVGLLGILLCGARTPALWSFFRTHLRTALQFLMIAPTPALALFCISLEYCISSYSFRPWIVSTHLYTVTFGLMYCDLWTSKFKKE